VEIIVENKRMPIVFCSTCHMYTGITIVMNQFNTFSCSSLMSFLSCSSLYVIRTSLLVGRSSFQWIHSFWESVSLICYQWINTFMFYLPLLWHAIVAQSVAWWFLFGELFHFEQHPTLLPLQNHLECCSKHSNI